MARPTAPLTSARSPRRLLALGAVALVAAATALVSGSPAAQAATTRTLSATFASTSGATHGTVAVTGTLSGSPASTPVAVQRLAGTSWTTVVTTRTAANGTWTATAPLPAAAGTYGYRAYARPLADSPAVTSPTTRIAVRQAAAVTLSASATTVRAGTAVRLTGTVAPFVAGGRVDVVTATGTAVASPRLSSTGTFTTAVTPAATTTYRVSVAARATSAAGVSPDVTVTVAAAVIVAATLPAGTVGVAYSGRLTTQGNLAGTWSLAAGTLAPLTLSSAGVIGGTPARAGDIAFTAAFTASASGLRDTRAFTVHVDPAPVAPAPGTPVVSTGESHSCRVQADHTLWCWGFNVHGQLGEPVNLMQPYEDRPTRIGTATTWLSVSAGSFYDTCGVRTDYTLWCWGWNTAGEVGDGTTSEQPTPVQVTSTQHWRAVAVGDYHACGLTTAGGLWCWGQNNAGQLGFATTNAPTVPTQVGTATNWTAVSAAGNDTCGLRGAGALYCWGANYTGQVGTGSTGDIVDVPTRVGTDGDWRSVDAGSGTTCGTRAGGTLWCWGLNRSGEIGDGTTTSRLTPTAVGVGATWTAVSAGKYLACGRRADATLWCWGDNTFGGLGDGTSGTNRSVPTAVTGGGTWLSVAPGGGHTCAVSATDGSQWCWGNGVWGQVGNGTRAGAITTPTKVLG